MKRNYILIILSFLVFQSIGQTANTTTDPSTVSGITGLWTFEDVNDLTKADVGTDLVLVGSHTVTDGPNETGATSIGPFNSYSVLHGIAPNLGGTKVNEYSILMDIRIPDLNNARCLIEADTVNHQGKMKVDTQGRLYDTEKMYATENIVAGQWYRLVISCQLGSFMKMYLNGAKVYEQNGAIADIDGPYSLDEVLKLFYHVSGNDKVLDVATIATYNKKLKFSEVQGLGGYLYEREPLKPYLQTMTNTSVYVNWLSNSLQSTKVLYGTTTALGNEQTGSYETVDGKLDWHTVKLSGLQANTEYYYQCISGIDSSVVERFMTPDLDANRTKVRFVVLGDTRDNTDGTKGGHASNILAIKEKLIERYGPDWHREIDFLINGGDVTSRSSIVEQMQTQYLEPVSPVSANIPIMISVGNHEENYSPDNYYQFVKYEELSDAPHEAPSDPHNEKFYKLRRGNCLIVSANSCVLGNSTEQKVWLEKTINDAEADPTIDFIFVFAHHPWICESQNSIKPSQYFTQDSIRPIVMNSAKTVALFGGHYHIYNAGMYSKNNDDHVGLRKIVSGGGGAPLNEVYPRTDFAEFYSYLNLFNYFIIEVDVATQKCEARAYTLGNNLYPQANVEFERWSVDLNQVKPDKPILNYNNTALQANAFSSQAGDSLMSSQIQITTTPGDYSAPVLDTLRNWVNYFSLDGQGEVYKQVNIHEGIDMSLLELSLIPRINTEEVFGARIRYRDHNGKWSVWSDEYLNNTPTPPVAAFSVDVNNISEGQLVNFSDQSTNTPTAWSWIFEGGTPATSAEQNPSVTYNSAGTYDVSLVVSNANGNDSINEVGFVTVNPSYGPLEAYYKFDGDVVDATPNGYDGVNSGGVEFITDGVRGEVASMDGTSHVYVPSHSGILGTTSRTVTAWIKTTATNKAIVSWGLVPDNGEKWVFRTDGAGKLRVEVTGGYVVGTALVNDNQWHHVACTWEDDGTPDVLDVKLYVDGQIDPHSIENSQTINTGIWTLKIGNDQGLRKFIGLMDDVHVIDAALTATEILDDYNQPVLKSGSVISSTSSIKEISEEPLRLFPNPSRGPVNIEFNVTEEDHYDVDIYDINGRHVMRLASRDFERGNQSLVWNGQDKYNTTYSAIYIIMVRSNETIYTDRVIILK